jgi:hypothetical protein
MATAHTTYEPQAPTSMASSRAALLKERLLAVTPEIDSERAELVTESYKQTEGKPIIFRKAKALENILAKMAIKIGADELIVGNHTPKPRSSPIFPEFSYAWIEAEFDRLAKRKGDVFLISEETKKKLSSVFKYWEGKTSQEYAANLMPPKPRLRRPMASLLWVTTSSSASATSALTTVRFSSWDTLESRPKRQKKSVHLI